MRPVALLFAAVFGLVVTAANAGEYKAGSLDISDPWARVTPKGSSVATGYMTIKNNGSTPDRLLRDRQTSRPNSKFMR
jgi:copper(I)-binding protein